MHPKLRFRLDELIIQHQTKPAGNTDRKPVCAHCGVKETPLWRQIENNTIIVCNACGLYWKTHSGRKRPTVYNHTNTNTIIKKPKNAKKSKMIPQISHHRAWELFFCGYLREFHNTQQFVKP